MKKTYSNTKIKFTAFSKRISRLLRVFFAQNKSKIKYSSLILASLASAVVIYALISGGTLGLSLLTPKTSEPLSTITPAPTQSVTESPVPHIYGDAPLVVLDASELSDSGYISQMVEQFSNENNYAGEYRKVSPDALLETYARMKEAGNEPNVVIAQYSLLKELGAFYDISAMESEVLFNSAAKGAVKPDMIPVALKMYGYFFRVDLLFAMSHEVPREYSDFYKLGERLRSDFAYRYLRYTEKSELLSDRADDFLTSRYGFGFPGGDVGGQLFIEQAIAYPFEDGTNILHEIKTMWDEIYLPPDTSYASDEVIEEAYINDALAGVYSSGTLYEKMLSNSQLFYNTQVKPYLGKDAVFTAHTIYCAAPESGNAEVASNFLSMLYNGGNLDKIIAQNHTAYLPISNFLNPSSPWRDALNDTSKIIFYEDDNYIQALKYIIMAGEDVESALAKTQK